MRVRLLRDILVLCRFATAEDLTVWLYCFSLSFIFGSITMLAGIAGVALGSFLSYHLKANWATADPIVCGVGLLLSAPLLLGTTFAATRNPTVCFLLLFLGQLTLNLNWAIVCDIVLVRKDDM